MLRFVKRDYKSFSEWSGWKDIPDLAKYIKSLPNVESVQIANYGVGSLDEVLDPTGWYYTRVGEYFVGDYRHEYPDRYARTVIVVPVWA